MVRLSQTLNGPEATIIFNPNSHQENGDNSFKLPILIPSEYFCLLGSSDHRIYQKTADDPFESVNLGPWSKWIFCCFYDVPILRLTKKNCTSPWLFVLSLKSTKYIVSGRKQHSQTERLQCTSRYCIVISHVIWYRNVWTEFERLEYLTNIIGKVSRAFRFGKAAPYSKFFLAPETAFPELLFQQNNTISNTGGKIWVEV